MMYSNNAASTRLTHPRPVTTGISPAGVLPTESNGDLSNGDPPNRVLPNRDLPNGDLPNRVLLNRDLPNGDLPNRDLPNGDLSNRALPNRDLPSRVLFECGYPATHPTNQPYSQ